ncbi:MAG: N utilization substance protein B, partial [Hydromonas sp.]|nr:N utilization substance protein B [Hydromonas sp.]
MKSARRRSRELAVQALYQWQITSTDDAQQADTAGAAQAYIRETPDFHKADEAFFTTLYTGVIGNADALRELITPHIDRPLAELSPVEHG